MKISFIKNPLFWIIVAGFILRICGIGEGLPALYNSTEHTLSKYALKMAAARTMDPGIYIYPSFLQYIIAFLYGIVFILGHLVGIYRDSFDFGLHYLVNPELPILAGRIVTASFSTLTILFIYRIAEKIGDRREAILAATMTAVSYYLVFYSHLAIHETFMIFFTVLALLNMLKAVFSARTSDYVWSGIFTGLAVAAKYNAGFLLLALVCISVQPGADGQRRLTQTLLPAIGGLLAAFFAVNPYMILAPGRYLSGFLVVSEQMYAGISTERGIPFIWEIWQILIHEWFIGLGFLMSIIFFVKRSEPLYFVSLCVILPTFIFVGTWSKKGIDYLLVCWPFLILLSARMYGVWQSRQPKLTSLYLAILFIFSSTAAFHQVLLKILPDTRMEASLWLQDNLEENEKICYDKNGYDLQFIDLNRFRDQVAHAGFLPDEIKSRLDDYKKMKRNVEMVSCYKIKNNLLADSVMFDFKSQTAALKWKSLAEVQNEGAGWLISDMEYRRIYLSLNEPLPDYLSTRIHDMREFYSILEKNHKPVKRFAPTLFRAGPEIQIYHLKSDIKPGTETR